MKILNDIFQCKCDLLVKYFLTQRLNCLEKMYSRPLSHTAIGYWRWTMTMWQWRKVSHAAMGYWQWAMTMFQWPNVIHAPIGYWQRTMPMLKWPKYK